MTVLNVQLMRLAAVVTAIAVPPGPLAAQAPRAAHGTYAVWICSKGCALADTAFADVAGFIVLSPSAIGRTAWSKEMREGSTFFLESDSSATACFRLKRRGTEIHSMAGIVESAATTWTQRGDTVKVPLYASPDAHFNLTAVANGGRLVGVGRESGFIGTAFDELAGNAHGVRIGAADVKRCHTK